jgi:hypothetical protein
MVSTTTASFSTFVAAVSTSPSVGLKFKVNPTTTTVNTPITPAVEVDVVDASGQVVTTASDTITIALGSGPAGALSGTLSLNATKGIALFSALQLNTVATGYTLAASAPALAGATSSTFAVTASTSPTQLRFLVGPSNGSPATPLAPAIQVEVVNASGLVVTTATPTVTIQLGANPTSATLSGTLAVAAVKGIATFSSLSVSKPGVGFTLQATAPAATAATSAAFSIVGPPVQIAFMVQPSNIVGGGTFSPAVAVAYQDAAGTNVPSTQPVTIGISVNPSGGTLSGTVTVNAVNGIATFPNLSMDKAGTGYKLSAIGPTVSQTISSTFNVLAGTAGTAAWLNVIPNGAAGSPAGRWLDATAWDGNRLYVFGGELALGTNELSAFDQRTGTWTTLTPNGAVNSPPARQQARLVWTGTNLLLFGGFVASGCLDELWSFDPLANAWTLLTAQNAVGAPSPRTHFGCVWDGTELIVYGGTNNSSTFTDVWWYDPLTNQWTLKIASGLPSSPDTQGDLMLWIGTRAMVWSGDLATAFFYTPSTNAWSQQSIPSPTPRTAWYPAACWDGHEAIFFATSSVSSTSASETWQYDPVANQWTKTIATGDPAAPDSRESPALVWGGTTALLFGGNSYALGAENDLWRYTPGSPKPYTAGAPTQFLVWQPTTVTSGAPFTASIAIVDSLGNVVATAQGTMSASLVYNPGGTLSGTLSVPVVNGVATFSNLLVDKALTGYQLQFHWSGGTTGDGTQFSVVPGQPASLVVAGQPSDAVIGQPISPAVQFSLYDAQGNFATNATTPVTIALAANPGTATLSGTLTVAPQAGVASFADLSLNQRAIGYTLTASIAGGFKSPATGTFEVTGPPASLVFVVQPSNTTAVPNAPLPGLYRYWPLDNTSGRHATEGSGNGVDGLLYGSPTWTTGVFGGALALHGQPDYVAAGTVPVLKVSDSFSWAFWCKLAQSASLILGNRMIAGNPFSFVKFTSADFQYYINGAHNGTISYGIPTTGTWTHVAVVKNGSSFTYYSNGQAVATSTTTADMPACPFQLGGDPGYPDFGAATLDEVRLYSRALSATEVTQLANPKGLPAQAGVQPSVQVEVLDSNGRVVKGASVAVTVALGANPGSTSLLGNVTATSSNGVAIFPNLGVPGAASGYTLTATAPGLPTVTSTTFNVVPGAPAQLVFQNQPTSAAAGAALSPAVTVLVLDAAGNVAPTATNSVTLALARPAFGRRLTGTLTKAPVNGVVTFSDLKVNKAATGYALAASTSGLTGATSSTFNIAVGPAASLSFRLQPTPSGPGATMAPSVQVAIVDSQGNILTQATTPVSLALGTNPTGAVLSGGAARTPVNGVATFPGLSIDRVGAGYTLLASAGTLPVATSHPVSVLAHYVDFAAPISIPMPQAAPNSSAIADVNGDGIPDLVFASYNANGVFVSLGLGGGHYGAPTLFPTGQFPLEVTIVDVNHDGKPDLLVVNGGDNTVAVLLGNGDGTFQKAKTFATGSSPQCLAVGDFNGDGNLDLAIANYVSSSVTVLFGDGKGGFGNAVQVPTNSWPDAIATVDLDGDGKLDLAVASNLNQGVAVFRGDGKGNFTQTGFLQAPGAVGSLVLADVNGDGIPDIVVTQGSADVTIFLNQGGFSFAPPSSVPVGVATQFVQVADVTGDGIPDLVVLAGGVYVLAGNGDGTFGAPQSYLVNGAAAQVRVADLNGDGWPDLVVTPPYNGSLNAWVLMNAGDGTFVEAPGQASGSSQPVAMALADMNGDGKLDLVLSDSGTSSVYVALGSGSGVFASPSATSVLQADGLAIGRLTPSGGLGAVVVGSVTTGPTQVAAMQALLDPSGTGALTAQAPIPAGNGLVAVVLGDLTGNGTLDVVALDYSVGNVLVFMGNGSGGFGAPTTFATGIAGGQRALAIADVNSDGKLDLIVANTDSGSFSVLLGDGHGGFGAGIAYPTGATPMSVVVADVDGDGIPDVIVLCPTTNTMEIHYGTGGGVFAPAVNLTTGPSPLSVIPRDLDGDGHLDLVVANQGTGDVSVFMGLGARSFAPEARWATGPAAFLAVGDLTGTGKPDLVTSDQNGNLKVLLRR